MFVRALGQVVSASIYLRSGVFHLDQPDESFVRKTEPFHRFVMRTHLVQLKAGMAYPLSLAVSRALRERFQS